jgi:hypothetical protein
MTLWSNGAINTMMSSDNRCDFGPNACGSVANWTIFDNFSIPASSKPWIVSSFSFSDFLVNVPNLSDYTSTAWSIWSGDPLSGGKLVASGTQHAGLSLVAGSPSCGASSTCLETFTITLGGTGVGLANGGTYYIGTSNTVNQTGSFESFLRAFAAGGNTAPGGTANPLQRWEQSNGCVMVNGVCSTSAPAGSSWTGGVNNNIFPGANGIAETATAFDVTGDFAPEPGTFTLLSLALAGMCYIYRRRTT